MKGRPYNRDALERALIHHQMDYSPPGAGQPKWVLRTGTGSIQATERETWFYVVGLADAERRIRNDAERPICSAEGGVVPG